MESLKVKVTDKDEYETVKNNKLYRIVVPSYLAQGGDGYTMLIRSKRKNQQNGLILDVEAIESFIALKSPITEESFSSDEHLRRIVMLT